MASHRWPMPRPTRISAKRQLQPSPLDELAGKKAQAEKPITLFHQHGALDNLPDWDRITVSRPSTQYSSAILYKGTNDWNQFTLFDLLGVQYELLTASPGDGNRTRVSALRATGFHERELACPFPDFIRIIIHRPSVGGTNWNELKIDLARALGLRRLRRRRAAAIWRRGGNSRSRPRHQRTLARLDPRTNCSR